MFDCQSLSTVRGVCVSLLRTYVVCSALGQPHRVLGLIHVHANEYIEKRDFRKRRPSERAASDLVAARELYSRAR